MRVALITACLIVASFSATAQQMAPPPSAAVEKPTPTLDACKNQMPIEVDVHCQSAVATMEAAQQVVLRMQTEGARQKAVAAKEASERARQAIDDYWLAWCGKRPGCSTPPDAGAPKK